MATRLPGRSAGRPGKARPLRQPAVPVRPEHPPDARTKLCKALPPALAATPLAAGAARSLAAPRGIWLWGDQAVIDLEARNSLLGRNLLGVYDRYGWHHLGPLWLLLLALFRAAGGGSADALVTGSFLVQVAAAAGIVAVSSRLWRSLAAPWLTALLVVGYECDFGPQRFGTVWAPYAISLPTALLVLLVADAMTSRRPWPAAFGALLCASFLVQTDVSTGVVVAALVALALAVGLVAHVRGLRSHELDLSRRWWAATGAFAAVAVVAWLPPIIQQLSTVPGNMTQLYRYFTTHHALRPWRVTFRALGTLLGTFPLHVGPDGKNPDSKLTWLTSTSSLHRPWYFVYLAAMLAVGAFAFRRGRREVAALAAATLVGLLAAAWSAKLAYGPLYPYLVVWMGALAVPAWVAVAMALAPNLRARARDLASRGAAPVAIAAAAAVSVGYALTPSPMAGTTSTLGRDSWDAVSTVVGSPRVRTVYVDIAQTQAMPEAAAIADQAVRLGRKVEVNREALYFFDPSFAPTAPYQVKVVVCCGRGDPGRPPPGSQFRARVGGQSIYLERAAPRPASSSHQFERGPQGDGRRHQHRGDAQRAEPEELPRLELFAPLTEGAAPEKGRQRTDVGEVGAGVDPDQDGEHLARAGGRGRRQEEEHGGEVVDDVRQGGCECGDGQ